MSSFHQYQSQPQGYSIPPQMQQQYPAPNQPFQQTSSHQQNFYNQQQDSQQFFGFQNVSPEMLNFGISAGKDMLNKQREKLMPGVEIVVSTLRSYFSVSNNYVIKKLKLILYPISNKSWTRISGEVDVYTEGSVMKYALPKQDLNAPDLYIPLMSFTTYILLYGLLKGIMGSSSFSPDILINAVWKCLLIQSLETLIIRFTLMMLNVTLPFLDIFAYTGFKYVGLCIDIVARGFGSILAIVAMIYTSLMFGYFLLKSLAAAVPSSTNSSGPPRHIVIIVISLIECIVSLFLNWL